MTEAQNDYIRSILNINDENDKPIVKAFLAIHQVQKERHSINQRPE